MSRYTLAELNRTALDAVTMSTPTAVLEGVVNRVSVLLSDGVFNSVELTAELHDAVIAIIEAAHADLDRIEQGASR